MGEPVKVLETADVTLWHGRAEDVLPLLEPGSVDAVVTDPPYGITNNPWDALIDMPAFWAEIRRIFAGRGVLVATAGQPFTSQFVMSNPDWFRHEWVWIKNRGSNFANTVREPMKEHESVLVFSPGGWTYNPQRQERAESGLDRVKYRIKCGGKSENYKQFEDRTHVKCLADRMPSSWQKFNCENGFHPTQKPFRLFRYLIDTYTNPGDLILDPFAGSGTTGVACLKSGRRCILVERDARYIQIIKRRISEAETPLFCGGGS